MESNKVVFLMDKSGTLVGEPVKLMREMAINIIKTMISDEDYISVLTFNQIVEPLGITLTFNKVVKTRPMRWYNTADAGFINKSQLWL